MWIFFALGGAILWALAYVVNEQIYRKISVITTLGITTLLFSVCMLVISYFQGALAKDYDSIISSESLFRLVMVETIVLIFAEICTGFAIADKNAVLTALIGISYPVFIVLFAWLLFKENPLTTSTIAGGSLIFLGIFIIYYFNG